MASNNQVWNMDYADEEGEFSQELMNSLMMRGGDNEEARVLKERNMDPDKNPLAYTVISYDNRVSKIVKKWYGHDHRIII